MILASNFCEETINAWKIVGIMLLIVKIAVPIIIILTGIIPFITVVTSGKADDLFTAAKKLFFKIIAGLIIMLIPTIIPIIIEVLSGQEEDSDMYICSTCLKSPGSCESKDPYGDENSEDEETESIGGSLDTGDMTDGSNTATDDD